MTERKTLWVEAVGGAEDSAGGSGGVSQKVKSIVLRRI